MSGTGILEVIILLAVVFVIGRFLGGDFYDNISRLMAEFRSLAKMEFNARSLNAFLIIIVSAIAALDLLTGAMEHIADLLAGSHSSSSGHILAVLWGLAIFGGGLFCIKISRNG
jgi:hypothetical protein